MKIRYSLEIDFYTDRELTDEEMGALQLQVIAQIEEPVNEEGEGVEYTTEFHSLIIAEVEEENWLHDEEREYAQSGSFYWWALRYGLPGRSPRIYGTQARETGSAIAGEQRRNALEGAGYEFW